MARILGDEGSRRFVPISMIKFLLARCRINGVVSSCPYQRPQSIRKLMMVRKGIQASRPQFVNEQGHFKSQYVLYYSI